MGAEDIVCVWRADEANVDVAEGSLAHERGTQGKIRIKRKCSVGECEEGGKNVRSWDEPPSAIGATFTGPTFRNLPSAKPIYRLGCTRRPHNICAWVVCRCMSCW